MVKKASNVEISAVVAIYKDGDAIEEMYARLVKAFTELGVEFEIVFVNDASPDSSQETIVRLSGLDERVIGVKHSRNFGSQAAFLSGMEVARGNFVVLLDGDLQDPPELIQDFYRKAGEGYDVVYGVRGKREMSGAMNFLYRSFYWVFEKVAPFPVPRDSGDFSLMSRRVVTVLTQMPERDLFVRAQRAYAGFRQTGVDYVRPKRKHGKSTNNLVRNIGWASRGILAVSRAPLTALSVLATGVFIFSIGWIIVQIVYKLVSPELVPDGITTVVILVVGIGATNLLALAVVGEYVGRVLEETKRRPRFVRESIVVGGEIDSSPN